jgi:hypothetical protein
VCEKSSHSLASCCRPLALFIYTVLFVTVAGFGVGCLWYEGDVQTKVRRCCSNSLPSRVP